MVPKQYLSMSVFRFPLWSIIASSKMRFVFNVVRVLRDNSMLLLPFAMCACVFKSYKKQKQKSLYLRVFCDKCLALLYNQVSLYYVTILF